MNGYFMDEQTLREVVESVGKTAAAACVTSFLSGVLLKKLVSVRPTEILVEDGVPAALYTIGSKDSPRAVYVSSKKYQTDWKPVIFFGLVFAGCKYFLDYRDKNVANIRPADRH